MADLNDPANPASPFAVDPTVRTAEAVDAARVQWRLDLFALREIMETRLDASDKAIILHAEKSLEVTNRAERQLIHTKELLTSELHDAVNSLRGEIKLAESATRQVAEVTLEKFRGVEATFASNALALTAALAASKEAGVEQNKSGTLAIAKSEQTTKETINSNAAQTTAGLQSQAALITDVKERVVRIEQGIVNTAATRVENRDERSEHRGNTQLGTQIIAAIIAVLAIAAILFIGLRNSGSSGKSITELPNCKEVGTGVTCVTSK